mmetsp:Transcript_87331/g.154813  ORF Transcript_87331/g.154813 Transcript_87331/m.154813 type:complete len:709 (-) Transcript_87331:104-2230(-)
MGLEEELQTTGSTTVAGSEDTTDIADDSDGQPFDLEADEASDVASEVSWVPEPDEEEIDGEILIKEAPEISIGPPPEELVVEPRKKKKKKWMVDPAALAARRVSMKFQADRKAAKKARKREAKKAKKRRGRDVDLEAFFAKTKERLEEKAAEAEAEASAALIAAAAATRDSRGTGKDIRSFVARTKDRLQAEAIEKAAAARDRAKQAQAAAAAAGQDLEDFRKKCQERCAQRLLSQMPQVRGGLVELNGVEDVSTSVFTRRRIAIVGAGPVGLWTALLLAQKYRWLDGSGAARLRPDAPEIVVLEARPAESHCTRTDIRIALSSSTQSMLNQRTKTRSFASGMPVAEIEETFIKRWKKVAKEEAKLEYGRKISSPEEIAEEGGFDCILWAAGRRSLADEKRKDLGCEVKVGDSQKVIVFQVSELQGAADAWQLGSLDLSGCAQQAGRFPNLRVMLRPGFGGACACWLWIFGLPTEVIMESFADKAPPKAAAEGAAESAPKAASSVPKATTLSEAAQELLGEVAAGTINPALEALQQRIKPAGITARFVDASYWSSDCSACELKLSQRSVPLVLLGDAVGGKPFYTGSTLNRHLWDVSNVIDEVEFAYDGGDMLVSRFSMHERRYQEYLRRIPEFQRSRASLAQAIPKPPPMPAKLRAIPAPLSPLKAQDAERNSPSLSKTPSLPMLHSGRSILAGSMAASGGYPVSAH